jgi:DNA-binding response OmpR family regulator
MEKEQKTIFLIDDDEFLLDMYALKFRAAGFNVEVAYGAEEALVKLKQGFSPDVVLLDVVMPKLDGFEFLETLKNKKLLANPLVVILSNLGQKEDIEKGKKLGAAGYIIKANYTPTEVVERVEELLATSH